MNNSLTTSLQYLDLHLGFDVESEVIKNVPYFDIDTEYFSTDGSVSFPLAVAFVDGSFILCFKYDTCLRACAYFNDSFVENEIIYDHLYWTQIENNSKE